MLAYRQPRTVVPVSTVGVNGCGPTHGFRDPTLSARRASLPRARIGTGTRGLIEQATPLLRIRHRRSPHRYLVSCEDVASAMS
jgi:hypothetical protein